MGTIGTGLFLGLGQILVLTGPLGSLLVYIHVSTVIYACALSTSHFLLCITRSSTILSVEEMTAYAPIFGLLIHYGKLNLAGSNAAH